MGAGSCEDHYLQDAAECYWTLIVQRELNKRDACVGSVIERETEFNDYCSERNILELFSDSDYKKNMDLVIIKFVDELLLKYPDKKMDIINVEAEYRNKGLKGDFIIKFDDDTETISMSLKNYRKGYSSIQLCSGTWHSFINNCVLIRACGPGMYTDCETGKRFKAQNRLQQRNRNYIKLGCEGIIPDLVEYDSILNQIREKYINSSFSLIFNDEVLDEWTRDCYELGNKGIDIAIRALDKLPKEKIKKNIIESADLYHKEELLLIGPNGEMMCSLFNESYKDLLLRVNKEDCNLSYCKHGKNLRMILSDSEGEILHIDIPFTLQKNGAWFLPTERYEGKKYHSKEGKELSFGERRPKKSKEISTSTNMWFRIKDYVR